MTALLVEWNHLFCMKSKSSHGLHDSWNHGVVFFWKNQNYIYKNSLLKGNVRNRHSQSWKVPLCSNIDASVTVH